MAVAERIRYVLDADRLSEDEQVAACRAVLMVVEPDIASFETDIPLSGASDWPADVVQAATYLSSVKPPGRGENESYRRTGEVQRSDEAAWEAFVVFAPYAYDATAWADDAGAILYLADAGTSVTAALTSEQAMLASAAVGGEVLVPLDEWRQRR